MVAPRLCHMTTLTCKTKCVYIYLYTHTCEKKLYTKLTYFNHLNNNNFEYLNLRITWIWVQQK